MSKMERPDPLKPESPQSEKYHSRSADFKKSNEKNKQNGKERFSKKNG
jgi:hypothetical protein